jgi:hypothetical protein
MSNDRNPSWAVPSAKAATQRSTAGASIRSDDREGGDLLAAHEGLHDRGFARLRQGPAPPHHPEPAARAGEDRLHHRIARRDDGGGLRVVQRGGRRDVEPQPLGEADEAELVGERQKPLAREAEETVGGDPAVQAGDVQDLLRDRQHEVRLLPLHSGGEVVEIGVGVDGGRRQAATAFDIRARCQPNGSATTTRQPSAASARARSSPLGSRPRVRRAVRVMP